MPERRRTRRARRAKRGGGYGTPAQFFEARRGGGYGTPAQFFEAHRGGGYGTPTQFFEAHRGGGYGVPARVQALAAARQARHAGGFLPSVMGPFVANAEAVAVPAALLLAYRGKAAAAAVAKRLRGATRRRR
jgi:hypothetical protein